MITGKQTIEQYTHANSKAVMVKLENQKTLIRKRIENKGIIAEDIYHKDRLTDFEIASIPSMKAYMWIKQGAWKPKHFNRWLEMVKKSQTVENWTWEHK